MDQPLADETIAAWLQPYLLVSTILCSAVGERPFKELVEATRIKLVYTTFHGMPEEGDPMTEQQAVEFLTRDYDWRSWCDNRLIDPARAGSMLDVVLDELRFAEHKLRRLGRDAPEALLQLTSEDFEHHTRATLSAGLRRQRDRPVMEELHQLEIFGVSDADDLSALWTTWAKIAPAMPPGTGSSLSDFSHSLLRSILSRRTPGLIEAIRPLPDTMSALVRRELQLLRSATQMAWSIAPGSPGTQMMGERLDRIEAVLKRLGTLNQPLVHQEG